MLFLGDNATDTFIAALRRTGSINSILLPSIYCDEVASKLIDVGIKCHYYDIDSELSPDFGRVSERFDALVMVNYFGIPSSIEPYQEMARISGAVLVDDNALGYGSADARGFLGLNAEIGMFSPRKTFNSFAGGFTVIGNPDRWHLPIFSHWEKPRPGAVLRRKLKARFGYSPKGVPKVISLLQTAFKDRSTSQRPRFTSTFSQMSVEEVKPKAITSEISINEMVKKLNTPMRQAIFTSVATLSEDMGAPAIVRRILHSDIAPSAIFWDLEHFPTVLKLSKLVGVPTYMWPALPPMALGCQTARQFIVMPINPIFWAEI